MPRTKKPAGTTVDKRNGRRADLVVAGDQLAKPDCPAGLCDEAAEQWDAFWSDSASSVQTPADRGVLLRWIDAVDRYLRTIGEADREPLVTGSTGQQVENPLYKIADKALGTIERCEKQLGIGALNRAGLGIAVITGQRSLADMNARYGDGGNDDTPDAGQVEADPRLELIEGDLV
jgi:P27 family predicted phage terminase small subunit